MEQIKCRTSQSYICVIAETVFCHQIAKTLKYTKLEINDLRISLHGSVYRIIYFQLLVTG
jgi:hypothetical protein